MRTINTYDLEHVMGGVILGPPPLHAPNGSVLEPLAPDLQFAPNGSVLEPLAPDLQFAPNGSVLEPLAHPRR